MGEYVAKVYLLRPKIKCNSPYSRLAEVFPHPIRGQASASGARGEGLHDQTLNVVDHKSNYLKPLFHPRGGLHSNGCSLRKACPRMGRTRTKRVKSRVGKTSCQLGE